MVFLWEEGKSKNQILRNRGARRYSPTWHKPGNHLEHPPWSISFHEVHSISPPQKQFLHSGASCYFFFFFWGGRGYSFYTPMASKGWDLNKQHVWQLGDHLKFEHESQPENDALKQNIYFGLSPCPVTVTTRIIMLLVGDPYKPSLATVTGRGTTQHILLHCEWFLRAITAETSCPQQTRPGNSVNGIQQQWSCF